MYKEDQWTKIKERLLIMDLNNTVSFTNGVKSWTKITSPWKVIVFYGVYSVNPITVVRVKERVTRGLWDHHPPTPPLVSSEVK